MLFLPYHMSSILHRLLILLLFVGIAAAGLRAQSPTKKQYLMEAENAFAEKNYYAALVFYNEVLEFDPDNARILYRSAESARKFNAYAVAADKYQYLVDTLQDNQYPEATFWLANMKQRMGLYEEARKYYYLYSAEYGGQDSTLTALTDKELNAIDFALAQEVGESKEKRFQKLGDDINTPASEVSGLKHGDDFYFSSMNYKTSPQKNVLSREISKILKKDKENTVSIIGGYLNERDSLVSNISLSPDGSTAYYTVCDYINGNDIQCEIFRSKLDSLGNFYDEQRLPEPVNVAGTTSTHPHVAWDKSTEKEILYFVSDREGGAGGLDIWYSLIDPKFGFSEPVNIEEINTFGDDITPFFSAMTDFLYFSSDARQGFGGFDIYKSAKTNDFFGNVIILTQPLNSSYNDIYYSEDMEGKNAYLSSNREGAYYIDEYFESCCYDIYNLEIVPVDIDLNVMTFDKLTGRDLLKATVKLIDQESGLELDSVINLDGIDHIFKLQKDRHYIMVATRENYFPDTIYLSTTGMDESQKIDKKMFLETDRLLLDVFTFTTIGKLPLEGCNVKLLDLTDGTEITEVNPLTNEFNFMPELGREYKIIATKEGFQDAVEYLDTRIYDKPTLITKELYLDKFILQDLLPISLFFDNDLPDPGSRSSVTKAKYGDLINGYIDAKEEFKENYTKPLKKDEMEEALEEFESFFEGDVKGGYDKFKLFLEFLQQELEAGNRVELILKGFASPRAQNKYNLVLGQRRVNSVKNEMIFFHNEELKKYYLKGQLVIKDISFGKELAPPNVSSDLKDRRRSVYSLEASRERRVEILRASRENK